LECFPPRFAWYDRYIRWMLKGVKCLAEAFNMLGHHTSRHRLK
jgi:hypothetical protein